MKTTTLTAEDRAAIAAAIKELKATSKANLIEEVKRNHRVISIDSTFNKADAISNIMATRFGSRKMDAYFA